jgi:WD40 repeat protein
MLTTEYRQLNPSLDEVYNLAYFVPKAMYTKHKASTPHKQLRNLMACKGYNAVVYASDRGADRSKVFHYFPFHDVRDCIMDLSTPSNDTAYAEPVRISTVALSTGDYYRGICLVGGLDGEYALLNMRHGAEDGSVMVGHATRASYGIINHIDIDYYAHGNEYRAVMACNDNKIRVLDVATNTFLSDPGSRAHGSASGRSGERSGHSYPWPVNCTAMSPYGKLRVVVGDTTDVSIVDAESGQCERVLTGHEDYGFGCAWSPDGYYIATANQDRLVKVWDVRSWRVVTEFAARVAGYRAMRWSPVGGGSKCLLLAEPADRVCVVNATTYETMQTHEFYGEIVGLDFHGDGTGFWVANADDKFGGMMEYERRGYSQSFGLGFLQQPAVEAAGGVYREQGANEWVWERDRMDDPRVVDPLRTGPAGHWVERGLD